MQIRLKLSCSNQIKPISAVTVLLMSTFCNVDTAATSMIGSFI